MMYSVAITEQAEEEPWAKIGLRECLNVEINHFTDVSRIAALAQQISLNSFVELSIRKNIGL